MSVPTKIRDALKERLWSLAAKVDWLNLSQRDKARYYGEWTADAEIGGVLSHYIDRARIRVYLKDTLLKPYQREASSDRSRPLAVLGYSPPFEIIQSWIKPHGCRLSNGTIVSWGRADDWKAVLMATHERAFLCHEEKMFVVLFKASGRFRGDDFRFMVENGAKKLQISMVKWIDS
jgi:hypothetical protein